MLGIFRDLIAPEPQDGFMHPDAQRTGRARRGEGGLDARLSPVLDHVERRGHPLNDAEECRIVIEDAIALLPPSARAPMLARALTKDMKPHEVEAVANEIGRIAHLLGRGEYLHNMRKEGL